MMAEAERHPSFLQLDRISLGVDPGEWREHVERCARCTRHLERLRLPVPVPGWVRTPTRRVLPFHWFFALATAAAAVAVVLLVVPRLQPSNGIATKGTPSVAVYVQRGEVISLWDGREPLAPGDRLQLEISPEGLRHVAVALRPASGSWQSLYRGELRGTSARVPESWRLDDAPGPESLGIALSQRPLSDAELSRALEGQVREARTWTTVLALPKMGPKGGRP